MYRVRAEGDPAYLSQVAGDPIGLAIAGLGLKKLASKIKRGKKPSLGEKLRAKSKAAGRGILKLGKGLGVPGASLLEQLAPKGGGRGRGFGGRRMRVTNPKALRRALRRVTGFAKTVKRTKRAIARAASAVGVHRGAAKRPFKRR